MITKLQIKTIAGEIAFEHECYGNTIKQTVIALLSAFKGKWINNVDLSNTDLSGIDFSNSTFYNSKFDNSKFYNSTFDNSTFDKSSAEGALNSGAFDSIKADFMYRMLKQKNEVPFLREKIIAGEIDGTCYEGECCCFVGTIAKAANCNYEKLPNLKPDSSSPTELWFYAFRKGYTPDNNEIAKITLGWIDEFLFLIQATPAPAE